ncbi:hypothetical protein [Streptomyces sp. AC495_CC817]|uniref:YobI family P-loop NTPase n=1 Tax=Streptomyces sp. AC495_CC817 TaxID=2823900 RepID=UPI001C2549E9|nr:hypothetical protein [Streptomyces sp. AC495_CC817]
MSENLIPSAEIDGTDSGASMRFISLAPQFDGERHQVYYDLLARALDHDAITNIAVTGPYGAGKSSVLEQLQHDDTYSKRLVQLSLSTIAPQSSVASDTAMEDDVKESSAPSRRVNDIQKEIVKQLLYTTTPEQVSRSRYRRNAVPDTVRNVWSGVLIGSGLWAILLALGVVHPYITTWFDGFWRHVLAYTVLAALLVLASWVAVMIVRSRPTVSATVNAANTTLSLNRATDTYFDDYLDEIVYVFQVTQKDIVVIEDIDRFGDVEIFDTLRALNALLNAAAQLSQNRIVFVYALRDSIFEQVKNASARSGADRPPRDTDHVKRTLTLASRTKFFDVIIPVVPFVSADNARDLMSEAMKSDEFEISASLIRLAARHVADMRLIHNIRNEFEIYRRQLVVPDTRIPGINDDLVFAIVLYKNTHLTDFENIRHKDSSLDRLYRAWRLLVATNLDTTVDDLNTLDAVAEVEKLQHERAATLARSLTDLVDDLNEALPNGIRVDQPSDLGDLDDPAAWADIAAADGIRFGLTAPRTGATNPLWFDADALTRRLGSPINPDTWFLRDTATVTAQKTDLETSVAFLKHHTWQQLSTQPQYTLKSDKLSLSEDETRRLAPKRSDSPPTASDEQTVSTDLTFSDLVDVILTSELARDLVRHGHITADFPDYAARYYGTHLAPGARAYTYRYVDPGVPDFTFSLTTNEVTQILREQGGETDDDADFFTDPSVLNVAIVDHLLQARPAAAATVATQLSVASAQLRDGFLDAYMTHGASPSQLLHTLAQSWDGTLRYAVASTSISNEKRTTVVDELLGALPHSTVVLDADVHDFLRAHYSNFSAVTSPQNVEAARVVLGILDASGIQLEELPLVNETARDVAVEKSMYPVTAANLRALIPSGTIGLDSFRTRPAAYQHLHANLAAFISIAEANPATFRAVADPTALVDVLSDLHDTRPILMTRLINTTPPNAQVPDLESVPPAAWPALAAARRVPPTFANVDRYISVHDIDGSLKLLLNKDKRILDIAKTPPTARAEMAYRILAASDSIPSTLTRATIAASLQPGSLAPENIPPEPGDLPARLLTKKLVLDDPRLFLSTLMTDWDTREKAIGASKAFASFVDPTVLPPAVLPAFIRSRKVKAPQKAVVIRNLSQFIPSMQRSTVRSLAGALINENQQIPLETIAELHAAGAAATQTINLLAPHVDSLSLTDLNRVLSSLGGDYARVVVGGRGRPHFPNDRAHHRVLTRYVGHTLRTLDIQTLKTHGTRIVAHLQR